VNPDRFARLKELLQEVVELSEKEREPYLDDACKDDPELRKEIESILTQEGRVPEILKSDAPFPNSINDPLISQTICHYQILGRIGEGGMGVVYKAEDTKLKRTVALKFLRRDMIGSGEIKSRFVHEAQAAASLDHPNICTVYAIDECGDQTFIAMAFVEGQSLKDQIAEGPLEPDKALDMAVQIAEGLSRAHSRGIVHRDIKPSNIMVTPEGRAKIMDFGLAKMSGLTQLTKTSTTLGTVAYMSPEQARGETVDHRTDIWSLGVLLYEMVTGQLPFRSKHEQAVIYLILNEEPQSVTAIREDLPIELERVVSMAISKNADDRYQTVADLLTDLCSLKDGLCPTIATPVETPDRSPSIAVLPFADLSPGKDQEYFCDGIAEELINALSRLEGLRVPARTSAFSFKGKDADIAEIGRRLKVSAVLEGSVRKAGKRLRITAQLINVTDGYHLWSERYDRELEDIFDIQDEISLTIVEKLKPKLLEGEKDQLLKRYTNDPGAYDLYLLCQHLEHDESLENLEMSVKFYEQAIRRDPNFALAYAGLAQIFPLLNKYGVLHKTPALERARECVTRALEIDETLCEAHVSQGRVHALEWGWEAAEQDLKRALSLNPFSAYAHFDYAYLLNDMWRIDEAEEEVRKSMELDPLDLYYQEWLAEFLINTCRYDDALRLLEKVRNADPGRFWVYYGLAKVYGITGMRDTALEMLDRAEKLVESWAYSIALRGWVEASAGSSEEAERIKRELETQYEADEAHPIPLARIYAALGYSDRVFEVLEKLVDETHDPQSKWIVYPAHLDFRFGELRSDPRWAALFKKMGLETHWRNFADKYL
jgi:serine/threonine protein kinase/Tfp pilus assembly protein PilF